MDKTMHVGLFITCLVDSFRPIVGFAAIKLLEDAGCQVHVPVAQTCCGLPAWNSGDRLDTREAAEEVIQNFEHFDFIITLSKPCTKMLKENYTEFFQDDPKWTERAVIFANKTYEVTSFLEEILNVRNLKNILDKRADILVGDDMAELLKISSQLKRQGIEKEIRHVTEVLAGMTDTPAIGARR